MSWFTGILTFLVIWWLVLFAVLPWGNRPAENPQVGHADSAPEKPRLSLKFLITTGIAIMVFLALLGIVESGWISLRE